MTENALVGLDDILQAQHVIAGKVHRTPMLSATSLGKMTNVNLHLKAELFQKTGSFKPRGAINKMNSLTDEERGRGVITISAGNHAAGLAYAASLFGVKATIVMPEKAPQSKVDATRGYGGEVIQFGDMKELLPKMQEIQQERNLTYVPPFDDLFIIAGQGTVGLEIIEDVPDADLVIVPVGGGGLISGVSAALKAKRPTVRIVGVEPVGAPAMNQSLQQNTPVHLEKTDTIADGLAAPFAGAHNLRHVQHFVDDMVLVTDEEIISAMALIMERSKLMPEPSGAASFAALLHGKVVVHAGERVVCVVSGGNVDRSRLKAIL